MECRMIGAMLGDGRTRKWIRKWKSVGNTLDGKKTEKKEAAIHWYNLAMEAIRLKGTVK